ncbi:hypothetical protein BGZ73_001634, partial [Actinomortierella ambigua]
GSFATAELAVKAAAEKRRMKIKRDTAGDTVGSYGEPSDGAEEPSDSMGNAGGAQDEADETGTKGDYGGFISSLLKYLRDPTSTIKVLPDPRGNTRNRMIRQARARYQAIAAITKRSLQVQSCGKSFDIYQQIHGRLKPLKSVPLDSSIINMLGAQLYPHLMGSHAIQTYLYAIEGEHLPGLKDKSPGWLLTRLITPVGHSMQAPANPHPLSRTTTTATVTELRALVAAVKNQPAGTQSSSQILMGGRPLVEQVVPNQDLRPGQPYNLLPSFLLRGMIVTDGRTLKLSAIDLRKRAKERFITRVTLNPTDGRWYRQHVLAPDSRRLLPNLSTAIPDIATRTQLFPNRTKVDIGAIDLGKEFAVAFACRRYDSSNFLYTIKAKNKALYQSTNKARKEGELVKANSTIN